MSKIEKLIASLLKDSADYPFSDVERVVSEFGFREIRSKGSHHMFRHADGRNLPTIPKKGGKRVKRIYVKRIVQLLELREWYEQRQKE